MFLPAMGNKATTFSCSQGKHDRNNITRQRDYIYTREYLACHMLWHYQNALQHPRLAAIFLLYVNTPLTTSPFNASLVEICFFWEEERHSWENKAFPSGKTAKDLIKTGT